MADTDINILIRAKDLASKTIKGVNRELGKTGKLGQGIRSTGDSLKTLGVVGAGVAAAGLVASVKVAADFESQLNTINTVAATTPEKLQAIGEGIRKIARDTGTPLEELTQGFYDLVSAGVEAGQAQQVLAASNTLAIGGLATAAEGVDLITTALNSYGVEAKDQGAESERFADIFAKSIERGKVTAAELAASFAQVGPLAASMGIEIEEVAAGYAAMTAKGVPAAEAATQMASAMTALVKKNSDLKKLEKQTGRNYEAIAGQKGLAVAYQQLAKDAEKAGIPLIELVGRKEALMFALATTGDAAKGYGEDLTAMSEAEGTAARQMASRQQGLNFQLSRLKALATDAGIIIGSKLLPKLTPLAEKAVAFLETHESDIDKFGDNIAGAFEKAGEFASRVPWGTIGSGLKTAAEWSGRLMDVFLSMPPQVQTTLIALAGLNKLSGGAVGSVIGELGKGLIKGVLGMNAGIVNINAAVVNGGGLPGAAAGAAGGIGAATLLAGAAITAAAVAAVAVVQQQISAESTAHAQAIQTQTSQWLAQSPTKEQLVNGLNGVKQGISDITSNPLLTLVQGEALTSLQTMESDITAQIARIDALHDQANRTKDDTVQAQNRTRDAALETKRETSRGSAIVSSTTRSAALTNASIISAAVARNRAVQNTSVVVNVTASSVSKSVTTSTRYGGTGASRSTDPGAAKHV